MASYLSTPDSPQQVQSPIDLKLLNQALATNQGRYDDGLQKYQNNLSQLKVQENLLLRDEDKLRFSQNVQGLIDEVNKSGKINWAKSGLTNKINTYTNLAIDDYTLDQIGISQSIRNFDAEMQKKREKNDGSYSDTNYAFAQEQAGIQQYLSGVDSQGNKVDRIGALRYTNYIDVNKKLNDQIIELEKLDKGKVIQTPILDVNGVPTGAMQETTVSNLSPDKIRQIAINSLNVQDQKQMEIDGWASTGRYADKEKIKADVTTTFNSQISDSKDKRDYWEGIKDKDNISTSDKKNAQDQYNYYASLVTNLDKNKGVLLENPNSAATYLQQQKVVDGAVARYSTVYNQSSVFKVDEVYQNKLDNARKDAELQLKYTEFEYKQKTVSGQVEAQNLIVAPKPTEHEDIPSMESKIDEQVASYGKQLTSETSEYKNKIQNLLKEEPSNKDAGTWMSLYNQNKKKGLSEVDAIRNAVQQTNGSSSILVFNDINGTPKNYRRSILDVSGKYDTYSIGRADAINKGTEEHVDLTLNNQKTFKAFYDNPATTMLWYKNGKLVSAPVKDVLISRGLMDKNGNKIGNLKEDADVMKALQRSFYASDVISNATFDGFSGKSVDNLRDLARSLGENPNEVLIGQSFGGGADTLGKEVKNFALKKGTKTADFLISAKDNGVYDTFGFRDNSLTGDDATISQFTSSNYKNSESYKKSIQSLYGKTDQNYTVGITPLDKNAYTRISSIVSSDAVNKATGKIDPKNTFNISISPSGDTVTIQQYDNDAKAGTTSFETTIDRNTFEKNLPQVANKLNFSINQAHYTIDRVKPLDLISNKIEFLTKQTNEQTYLENINALRGMSEEAVKNFTPYLKQEDAVKIISDRLIPAFGANSKESIVVQEAMKNSSNFSIVGNVAKDFDNSHYLTLMLKNKSGETIYKKNVKNISDVDNFKNIIDNSPQVYFADMISDIMQSQKSYRLQNNTNSPYYEALAKNL